LLSLQVAEETGMDRGIYPIVSGAIAQERRIDMLTENLANIQTAGYKRQKPLFKSVLSHAVQGGAGKGKSDQVFTKMAGSFFDWKSGSLKPTGNPLDLALAGDGFFAVKALKGGTEYTRNGNFILNAQRELTTRDGALVLGEAGPIQLPVGKVTVNETGEVQVDGAQVDTLRVMQFKNFTSTVQIGERYATKGGVIPATGTVITQGTLEESNVNAVEELVQMVELHRNYEAALKVIQTMDETAQKAANEIGRAA
jgi:flagellar basal-body rod protein FlgF